MFGRNHELLLQIQNQVRSVSSGAQTLVNLYGDLKKIMSTIANELAAVTSALTQTQADVATIAAGNTDLNNQIADHKNQIANSGSTLTPADQAALDAVASQAAALKTAADAAAAELPATPAPPAA